MGERNLRTFGSAKTFIASYSSVYVDAAKRQEKLRHGEDVGKLHQKVDLDDPVSFIDQVYLGCAQRAVHVNERIVMGKQKMFSKLISVSTDVKTEEKNPKDITAWIYDMEGHTRKCVERDCEEAHKTSDQLHTCASTE